MNIEKFIQDLRTKSESYGLDITPFINKINSVSHTAQSLNKEAELYALNRIDMTEPNWTFVAAHSLMNELYEEAAQNRGYNAEDKYGNFYELVQALTDKGIYSDSLLETYTKEEIEELGKIIDPSRDENFNYIGLFLIADRYIARDHEGSTFELPQERWLTIAMTLMAKEKENRLEYVKEMYWALSNFLYTVATPTLSNAGKSYGQLSSCFIDTVGDSLDNIYLNNWDTARLSKSGGGLGVYLGKIRAMRSDIKKFKGKSSGIIPWAKQLNNTAVSVDQLGQRQGAFALYIDVFHKDAYAFSDLKLNNGDDRLRAHDVYTGFSIPDLFMKKLNEVDENGRSTGRWNLFCPYEVKKFMGWKDENGVALGLEDFYDETDVKYFTEKYNEAVAHPLLPRIEIRAMDLMARILTSQIETGTPYMFYRDTVNQMNVDKHPTPGRTTIFCSNLCTEIAQSMSVTEVIAEYIDENENIVLVRKPGNFVVCNLASINLPQVFHYNDPEEILTRLIRIIVRGLDNVIDLNTIEVLAAQITNKRYRGIGVGTFGWAHLLALKGIAWDSEEAVKYADAIYEDIAYEVIKASVELSEEKGAYKRFEGSEWESGKYFERKGYESPRWLELKDRASKGIRNAWLMAIAPNSSTAKIGKSTDGIDPLFKVEYAEEKKNFKFKVTAPDLTPETYEFYRHERYDLDQHASIRQNAARQRHIDQAISFNLYIKNDIKAKDLLALHVHAWEAGLKTTYYTHSTSMKEIKECAGCHS